MKSNKDIKNGGYVEVTKHTKFWFKKDVQTIKMSFLKTLWVLPYIYSVTFLVFIFLFEYLNFEFFKLSLKYSLSFGSIIYLAYFLTHVMNTKGYNIGRSSTKLTNTDKTISKTMSVVKYLLGIILFLIILLIKFSSIMN